MVYMGPANANDPAYSGAYGTKYSSYGPGALGYMGQQSFGQGQMANTQLQSWLSGFFGNQGQGLGNLGQFFGGAGKYQGALENSLAYQGLLGQAQQPWESYYGKISPQLDALYGDAIKQAQAWLSNANPSGAQALNAQQLYAQGMVPVQQAAQATRSNLATQGAQTGGMSGTSVLASFAPSQMLGGAGGQVATQASIGANQSEMQRAGINAAMKGQALGTVAGAKTAQASQLAGLYAGHSAFQQNALQAAMAALAQILGLEASVAPKFSASYDPSTGAFSPSFSFSG